ncbi:hypothetical protein [Tardiphaga sp.]|jgi:hypothetical protein|uniref:hypothetical protein n=1 Tax=Tardiphaga sp. TaxID=1926292 RepID=UPI0037D9E24E
MQQVTAWALAAAGLVLFGAGIYFMRFTAVCGPNETGIECIRSWISAIGPLIAGAALLIAFAQYSLSEDTRNRQLRAYVTLIGGAIAPARVDGSADVNGFMVHAELKNSGVTPGYQFTTWIAQPVVMENDALPFAASTAREPAGRSIIAPATGVFVRRFYAWKDREIEDVIAGKKAIFVWGGANYEDAFGQKRSFLFRLKVNGMYDEANGTWGLKPHPLGYEGD